MRWPADARPHRPRGPRLPGTRRVRATSPRGRREGGPMSQHVAIDDLLDLSGRTALVTGGAMGVGQAIARRLAEARADVVVGDADLEAAEQTCKVLVDRGLSARAVRCDVAHEEE